jgi:hypothetical protein
MLDDFEFHCLPTASKALAPCLWLLASEFDGGVIEASSEKVAFRFRLSVREIEEAVAPLICAGFFEPMDDASKRLALCYHDALLETEVETEA